MGHGDEQSTKSTRLTRRSFGALLVSALASGEAHAGNLALAPSAAVDAPLVPSRGFNLPGWVDRESAEPPAPAVLEKLRQLGFETVRLPVAADPLLASGAAARKAMLGRVAGAIAELLAFGFAVIVDLHPAGAFASVLRSDVADGPRRATETWSYLGDVLADSPADRVYAELLNEPPMAQAAWLELRERLGETVRAKCPAHVIVWGAARYQGIWEMAEVPPLADDRSIAAVHYYAPLPFTHQCQDWDGSALGRLANLPFPATRDSPAVEDLFAKFRRTGDLEALALLDEAFQAPWTALRIAQDFRKLSEWSSEHGCPVILNEFGVLNFCADPVSRATWIRAVRNASEANGIGWTYWEFDRGFGFVKDRRSTEDFDRSIVDALMAA